MFTGIIQAVGRVQEANNGSDGLNLRIRAGNLDLTDVVLGDSIAVNGVCLTVVNLSDTGFSADVSRETLACTTAQRWKTDDHVNLEKALTPSTRLGGHMVSGHVDGVAKISRRWSDGNSERFRVEVPASLSRYIAAKGSICVDGVSLTVNKVEAEAFELNIVPHTLDHTIMSEYQIGRTVNIEVDLIARYLERLIMDRKEDILQTDGVTTKLLRENGFL